MKELGSFQQRGGISFLLSAEERPQMREIFKVLDYTCGGQDEESAVFYHNLKPEQDYPRFHLRISTEQGFNFHYDLRPHRTDSLGDKVPEELERLRRELWEMKDGSDPNVVRVLQKEIMGALLFLAPETLAKQFLLKTSLHREGEGRCSQHTRSQDEPWREEIEEALSAEEK